jgi:hypothetical protein
MIEDSSPKVSKGEVIALGEGEDDSVGVAAFVVALQDFDMAIEAKGFAESEEKKGVSYPKIDSFIAFLITEGMAIPVEHRDIYLGRFGMLEIQENKEE